ncbi:MAG: hydrolase [Alphaproteobacteria bacterium]|nr:MAG: hydrolase [Caulobacteraceae bacterium]TPW07150.1 MAG: hydrolase [Alphaproteobacteria bacterium]
MEERETAEEGAACDLAPRISQVRLMYRARLLDPEVAAGPESTDVALPTWDEIPWSELAFPSVKWALEHFAAWRAGAVRQPAGTDPPLAQVFGSSSGGMCFISNGMLATINRDTIGITPKTLKFAQNASVCVLQITSFRPAMKM